MSTPRVIKEMEAFSPIKRASDSAISRGKILIYLTFEKLWKFMHYIICTSINFQRESDDGYKKRLVKESFRLDRKC